VTVLNRLAATSVPIKSVDAVALYSAAVEADLEAVLWLRPSEQFALVGIGRAWSIEPAGPERFLEADAAWRALVDGARISRRTRSGAGAGAARRDGIHGPRPRVEWRLGAVRGELDGRSVAGGPPIRWRVVVDHLDRRR